MRDINKDKRMVLGAGLQSSGSTLVSWCFLQRWDTDGILDLESDELRLPPQIDAPITWAKMTISSFRWNDVAEYYRWNGLRPEPLLIIRDVRDVYSSLRMKEHGVNGLSAEDPPLRIRFLRYLDDWRMFRDNGWPVIKYEDVVENTEEALRSSCESLSLSWDKNMIEWRKNADEITDIRFGSQSFHGSRGTDGLAATLSRRSIRNNTLPRSELEWMEEVFDEYNRFEGYDQRRTDYVLSDETDVPASVESSRLKCAKEVERLKLDAQKLASDLNRIQSHPVFGKLLKLWSQIVNPDFPSARNY